MSNFVPDKHHLRVALLFLFHLKKNATAAHQMLVEAYGNDAASIRTCQEWFQRFRSGDFELNDKDHGKPLEDEELQALVDEDAALTQEQLASSLNVTQKTLSFRLRAMGKIQQEGKWMP